MVSLSRGSGQYVLDESFLSQYGFRKCFSGRSVQAHVPNKIDAYLFSRKRSANDLLKSPIEETTSQNVQTV